MKERIKNLLRSTGREGIEGLLEYMDKNGFYTSPCSTQFHLNKEGGLAEHSLNVYQFMIDRYYSHTECGVIQPDFIDFMTWEEVVIVSLLHDIGKTGQFGKQNYVPNMIKDKKGGYVQSDKKPFETNKDLLTIPHEIRSIQITSQFIELTEEENFAILHHNGMYSDLKYQLQGKERPLQMLLHFSDMWCSRVTEVK